MNIKEIKKEYEDFINSISNRLESLKRLLNKERLDYSNKEADKVFDLYSSNLEDDEIKNIFYTYAGEIFIKNNGGEWSLGNHKKDKAFGTPIIINWGGENYPWVRISPYVWSLRMKNGNFEGKLSDVIQPRSKFC